MRLLNFFCFLLAVMELMILTVNIFEDSEQRDSDLVVNEVVPLLPDTVDKGL